MPKQSNLPYSKADRVLNDFGRWLDTGEKSSIRIKWEELAGTDDDKLTNQDLIDIINNKNDEGFKQYFKSVLDKIEESMYGENLIKIENTHIDLKNYPPFIEAMRLKRQYFKELGTK